MSFEENLQRSLFSKDVEKTYIDKLLARKDVERIAELIKKEKLNRSELLELLYMCLGTECKLLNLGEWDRYIILKFFVWIREFIKIAELMYDNKEYLENKENVCLNCKKGIKKEIEKNQGLCSCEKPNPSMIISKRTKEILQNNEKLIEHNAKFLIDLYLNICRTTLSLGGTGFLELLKNKFEMAYPQGNNTPQEVDKPSVWKLGGSKK